MVCEKRKGGSAMTDEKDKEVETLDTRDFDAEIEEIIDLIE